MQVNIVAISIWHKIHRSLDEEELEIRSTEVTSSNIGGPPMLSELLNQISSYQDVGSVATNGAYDIRKYHEMISA